MKHVASDAHASGIGRLAVIGLALALSGCAVGPDFVRPPSPAVDRYLATPAGHARDAGVAGPDVGTGGTTDGGPGQRIDVAFPLARAWWRMFGSAGLDAAVDEAVRANPGLQAAQASLRASQENLKAGFGVFYPLLAASAGATREHASTFVQGGGGGGPVFDLYTMNVSVSYAVDVFGSGRRTVESLQAQSAYQFHLERATYVTLTANVVNTVIARAGYQAQAQATGQLVAIQQDQVAIARAQAEAGTVPWSSVLSLQSQLASNRALLPALRQRIDQSEHLLSVLMGRPPVAAPDGLPALDDLVLPADLPLSLPSDLVRQRPDILQSEDQLHQASAAIGVATAAMFPSVSLTGGFGNDSNRFSSLPESSGRFWSLGADVNLPVFSGGTLWFRRQAARESFAQSLALYRQTVLAALGQVADTLQALQHDAEAVAAQDDAMQAARQALDLMRANHQAGLVDYLQLLTVDGQYQQAQIALIQARTQRLQDDVALLVALGGGWWQPIERTGGADTRTTTQARGEARHEVSQ